MKLPILLERLFGKAVDPESVVALKGDASSRRYHRVVLPPGLLPRSLIVMELPEDALKSDEAESGATPPELPFLNMGRFLAEKGVRVPRLYLDAAEDGALLIEDLGDRILFDEVDRAQIDRLRAWYGAAVDLLVDLHHRMWPVPAGCVAGSRRFDCALLRWELDHYREWGIEALRGRPLAGPIREKLDQAFDRLSEDIAALESGFVHRDYQSRNLMVLAEEADAKSLGVIDFQDALIGPRIYDLVALLNDSYVDLPDAVKAEMIARYAEKKGLDRDRLTEEFHLVAIQRKLKDGGRFVFIDRVKKNPRFLPFVEGSFSRVRRSLAALPGRSDLKAALAEADPAHFA